jgi:thioredoxin reductase (NADPH)
MSEQTDGSNSYDVIVVGGGIAGMTAAIYASRANLSVLVLERQICGGLANWTHTIENYPGFSSINGMELMENIKQQTLSLGTDIEEIAEISGFDFSSQVKEISIDDQNFSAKAVILSTGRVPISLPLEDGGFEEHLHYCSVCDGASYKGKSIIIVGGGNSAFDESLYLTGLGVKSILMIDAMDDCIADETIQQKAKNTGVVSVLTGHQITEIKVGQNKGIVFIENIKTNQHIEQDTDGLFVFIGQKPNTEMFKGAIELDDKGYILVDGNNKTNVDGVYAAGDVIPKKHRQLTTASSDGTIAALEVREYISANF